MNALELVEIYSRDERIDSFLKHLSLPTEKRRLALKGLIGSMRPLLSAAICSRLNDAQIFILQDKEAAAYFHHDIERLLGQHEKEQAEKNILFFPDSRKRNFETSSVDNANVLMRAEVLNRLQNKNQKNWVITYPEALCEKVITQKTLKTNTIRIEKGQAVSRDFLLDYLYEYNFESVDFVVQAGEYSIRGGIIDIYSYANDRPYRIEFSDDTVESIRSFDVSSQLSIHSHEYIDILPNISEKILHSEKVSFISHFSPYSCIWLEDLEGTKERIRVYLENIAEDVREQDYIKEKEFIQEVEAHSSIEFGMNFGWKHHFSLEFHVQPQAVFRKNFSLLVEHIREGNDRGFQYMIFSENENQIKRLERVFKELSKQEQEIHFIHANVNIHEGFVDIDKKLACYTDHQIFERYHKPSIQIRKEKENALSLRELYSLKPGDFISHIDHGVGRFGGLEKVCIHGKQQETIRLVYKDNDILQLSIHALHKISRYSGKEGSAPSLHRLGGSAWGKVKSKAKQKIKDIAKDLLKLYAQRKASKGFAFSADSYLQNELESSFFYEDTPDQLKASIDVKRDMESTTPMDRLVCGDVGFGKTEVAIRAAFKAVADSKQVAVLVPTTILAYQHAQTFKERLEGMPCRVEYLNRFKTTKEKNEILKGVKEGKIDILIGTHRIVGKDVFFKDLGLLIIDEEQKFGVAVKEKLKQFKVNVDTLTLTATPIPRTLQFSLMGARDLSVINTPPLNRYPVQTEICRFEEEKIRDAISYELSRGGQIFFVHHRVQSIPEVYAVLEKLVPDAKIGIAHGQMDGEALENVLLGFMEGEYDILLATKIVENGLDIPNANTIIINEANMYGLSELHQLRGRVGRSNKKAFCYMIAPPSHCLTEEAKKRLRAIEEFSDIGSGFQVAMRDLDIRGAGNILGGEQSGFIADMGFEMYHKILDESIQELKESEFKYLYTDDKPQKKLKDCQIETDFEILIPDHYVSSISERLSLYKDIDQLASERELHVLAKKMKDRFGPIPLPTRCLFDLVRFRFYALEIGVEKAVFKNGKLVLHFIQDIAEEDLNSEIFTNILQFISAYPLRCKLHQNGDKLSLEIKEIEDISSSITLLKNEILKLSL